MHYKTSGASTDAPDVAYIAVCQRIMRQGNMLLFLEADCETAAAGHCHGENVV